MLFIFYHGRKAREDEKRASVRLNEMIANYGDVIPRRDFEALEKKHKVSNLHVPQVLKHCALF
jgi:hypothetical protein